MTIYSYPVMHFEREIQTENRNFNVNSTANGSDKNLSFKYKKYLFTEFVNFFRREKIVFIFLLQKLILLEMF